MRRPHKFISALLLASLAWLPADGATNPPAKPNVVALSPMKTIR